MERLSQEEKKPAPGQYLIVFQDRNDLYWWDRVFRTRPGFRHAFMLYWDEWAKRYLLLDWRREAIDMMIVFEFEAQKLLEQAAERHMIIVSYQPESTDQISSSPLFITYCTNLLARKLGFGNYLWMTPYRLYRKLLAAGGRVMFDWRSTNGKIKAINNP